ncbi:hypothetical protein ACFQ0Q_31450 [Streptomyces aureus]
MSDSEAPEGSPDFLDRLLARHTAPRPAAARVRPRLPGPFERVEAVRAAAPAPGEDALLWPAATPPTVALPECRRRRLWRRGRTRNGRGPSYTRSGRLSRRGRVRPLRPAPRRRCRVPPSPSRRRCDRCPTPGGVRRCARSGTGTDRGVRAPPPGRDAAPHAGPAALPPSAAGPAATRDAVRQAAARRPARATEQVVQVQIGRLEVTAGEAPGAGRPRTPAAGRARAALSLTEYLARGRE